MTDLPDINDLVDGFPLFEGIQSDALVRLKENIMLHEYEDDQVIYGFNEKSSDTYFIFSGAVKTLNQSSDGQMVFFEQRDTGDYFGMACAVTKQRRAFEVRTVGKTLLGKLEGESFVDIFTADQKLAKSLIERLSVMVHERFLLSSGQSVLPARGLVAFDIIRRAGEEDHIEMPVRNEWAAYLGITRETLSRTLSQLKDENIIALQQDNLKILNLDALGEISSF